MRQMAQITAWVAMTCATTAVCRAESREDLAGRLAQTFERMNECHIVIRHSAKFASRGPGQPVPVSGTVRLEVRRSRDSWHVLVEEKTRVREDVVNKSGHVWVDRQNSIEEDEGREAHSFFVGGSTDGSSRSISRGATPIRYDVDTLHEGAFVFGFVPRVDIERLDQFIREGGNIENAVGNARNTVTVSRACDYGNYTIVLDKRRDYAPVQVRGVIEAHHQYQGALLSKERRAFDVRFPGRKVRTIEIALRVNDFVEVDNVWCPASIHGARTFTLDNRESVRDEFTTQIEYESIGRPIPDSEFVIGMEIPNYTSVEMSDMPTISCIWMDGQVVKAIDLNPLTQAEQYSFQGVSIASRIAWTAAGVGLIVAVAAVSIWRVRAKA